MSDEFGSAPIIAQMMFLAVIVAWSLGLLLKAFSLLALSWWVVVFWPVAFWLGLFLVLFAYARLGR